MNHAKLKITKQEMKVKELHEMETKEHLELKSLLGDIRSYNLMVTQLRTKISSLDFQKNRERIFLDKLGIIN